MIEFALTAYLATRAPVTDIVGPRISADLAEQDDPRPLLVYRLLPGSTRHYHSQGASGLVEAHIELTCQGNAYVEARGLYDVLRDELDGFQGAWDGTEVRRAALTTPAGVPQNPAHGDETGFPTIKATLEVVYRETIPALGAAP